MFAIYKILLMKFIHLIHKRFFVYLTILQTKRYYKRAQLKPDRIFINVIIVSIYILPCDKLKS